MLEQKTPQPYDLILKPDDGEKEEKFTHNKEQAEIHSLLINEQLQDDAFRKEILWKYIQKHELSEDEAEKFLSEHFIVSEKNKHFWYTAIDNLLDMQISMNPELMEYKKRQIAADTEFSVSVDRVDPKLRPQIIEAVNKYVSALRRKVELNPEAIMSPNDIFFNTMALPYIERDFPQLTDEQLGLLTAAMVSGNRLIKNFNQLRSK